MVKLVKSENLSDENYIANIRANPGCTTEDIADYIKPIIRRKPDITLVHTGTNDLINDLIHLNRKGTTLYTKNIYKSFSSRFDWNTIWHATITDSTSQPSLDQNIPLEKLNELRLDNPKNLTFSYLNINSVRNKFDSLQEIVMGKVDILIVAETKIDASFPIA